MLKKIAVDQLTLGMHIHEFCGSYMSHPFWREKFVLDDPKDLRSIKACGVKEVWIDNQKGVDVQGKNPEDVAQTVEAKLQEVGSTGLDLPRPPLASMSHASTSQPRTSHADEIKRAAKICSKAKEAVVSMFKEARMGKAVDHAAAGALVEEISGSVMRNPGALISLARLRSVDDYTYMHSVAVCALMVSLSRVLDLDEKQTRDAGMAGLLHDLGKALMPMAVLNKPGKLTEQEFNIIKGHPTEGHRMLVSGGGANEVTLDVCLHHHEKVDGSGYPKGLKDNAISLFAKMGAVCDVYDAITSNRPYKSGWDPAESIRKMTEWSKGHYDPRVFHAFVRSIGIYPTGSLVRLASDNLAVVIEQTPNSLVTPVVKVFYSVKSRSYQPPHLLDLANPRGDDKIVGREDAAKWGIKDLDRFWAHP